LWLKSEREVTEVQGSKEKRKQREQRRRKKLEDRKRKIE